MKREGKEAWVKCYVFETKILGTFGEGREQMWLVGSEGSGEVVGRSHRNTRGGGAVHSGRYFLTGRLP